MEIYQQFFETAPALVVERAGRITRANAQVERLFGHAPNPSGTDACLTVRSQP